MNWQPLVLEAIKREVPTEDILKLAKRPVRQDGSIKK